MQKRKPRAKGTVDKVNTCIFYLIKVATDAGATRMKVKQENVHNGGKQLGTWEMVLQRVEEGKKE